MERLRRGAARAWSIRPGRLSRRRPNRPTSTQAGALARLRRIAKDGGTPLVRAEQVSMTSGQLVVRLRINTSGIEVVRGGLPVDADHEDVLAVFTPSYPLLPPLAGVDHDRFVGHAHVLQGDRLCVYLDPEQEWHPDHGVVGFLDRLWRWFEDAAADRFDARTALYHPVGGVLHADRDTPTVVVRSEPGDGNQTFSRRWLRQRSSHRLDLVRQDEAAGGPQAAVITLSRPLRYGAGTTVAGLSAALLGAQHPKAVDVLGFMAQTAARNPRGDPIYFVLAVPDSETDTQSPRHLVCGRLPGPAAEQLRRAALRDGAFLRLTKADIPFDAPIEWCTVSEERQAATTRRDSGRPVSAYAGKHVVVWGCGGLGSWTAEFLTRAGVARITLCDPANISGGLLVRQDYEELDIGTNKAAALERRVQAIRDNIAVDVVGGLSVLADNGGLPACDLVIDATVSNTAGALLTATWASTTQRPLVARISTDRATSTLGLLTVTTPAHGPTPEEADRQTGDAVRRTGSLEPYLSFWDEVSPEDELTPTPGCSTPTFHGSAADLAAMAGTLVSLLGPHLDASQLIGSHLAGLPHGPAPGHRWVGVHP